MKKTLAVAALLSFFAAGVLTSAAPAIAHGGFPTRLGVRQDPDLVLLARLALVYLVDGEGMNVHLTVFDAGADTAEKYASGKIDLFLDMFPGEVVDGGCRAADGKKRFDGSYPGAWVGPFGFHVGDAPCRRPALIAHSRVAADLRFTLMRETLEKLLAAVTQDDLERLRREGGESPRDAASAARRILKDKGLL